MLNINYENHLTQFEFVNLYDIFRFSDRLYMKVPELSVHKKIFTDGFKSSEHEFRPVCYNAVRLNTGNPDDAYVSFALSCKVQVLDCELVIKN